MGQYAPVDMEARDVVQHRLARDVYRDVAGQMGGQGLQLVEPLGVDQKRGRLVRSAARQQDAQHHFALGDESAFPPDKIALAHVAIDGDPWVFRVVDGDDLNQGLSLGRRARAAKPRQRLTVNVYRAWPCLWCRSG